MNVLVNRQTNRRKERKHDVTRYILQIHYNMWMHYTEKNERKVKARTVNGWTKKTKDSEQMFGLNFKAEIFTKHSLHPNQQEGGKPTPDKQKYMSLSLSYFGLYECMKTFLSERVKERE